MNVKLMRFLLTVLVFCSVVTAAYADLFDEIKSRGFMRVAVFDSETPPFMTKNKNGEYVGLEMELIREIADKAGVKYELVPCESTDEMIMMVEKGKVDMALSELSRTPERAERVLFTKPYATLHYSLLIKRTFLYENMGPGQPVGDFVRTYTGPVSVLANSAHVVAAKKMFPKSRITEVRSVEEQNELIRTQKLTLYMDDHVCIRNLCRNNPSCSVFYKRILLTDTVDPICIAVRSDRYHAVAWLNIFLENNKKAIEWRIEHPDKSPIPFF